MTVPRLSEAERDALEEVTDASEERFRAEEALSASCTGDVQRRLAIRASDAAAREKTAVVVAIAAELLRRRLDAAAEILTAFGLDVDGDVLSFARCSSLPGHRWPAWMAAEAQGGRQAHGRPGNG